MRSFKCAGYAVYTDNYPMKNILKAMSSNYLVVRSIVHARKQQTVATSTTEADIYDYMCDMVIKDATILS